MGKTITLVINLNTEEYEVLVEELHRIKAFEKLGMVKMSAPEKVIWRALRKVKKGLKK